MLFRKRCKIQNVAIFVIGISFRCYSGNAANYKYHDFCDWYKPQMLFVKRRKIQNIATFVIDISLGCYSGNTAKYKKIAPEGARKNAFLQLEFTQIPLF